MTLDLSRPAQGSTDWFSAVDGNWATLDALNVGKVTKAINHTWEGDNTSNRTIDLGDDYDWIFIYREEVTAGNAFNQAAAYRNVYTHYRVATSAYPVYNYNMSDADPYWQGKMTGADANKIKLGSTGNAPNGTNYTGKTYRLIGLKFSGME